MVFLSIEEILLCHEVPEVLHTAGVTHDAMLVTPREAAVRCLSLLSADWSPGQHRSFRGCPNSVYPALSRFLLHTVPWSRIKNFAAIVWRWHVLGRSCTNCCSLLQCWATEKLSNICNFPKLFDKLFFIYTHYLARIIYVLGATTISRFDNKSQKVVFSFCLKFHSTKCKHLESVYLNLT